MRLDGAAQLVAEAARDVSAPATASSAHSTPVTSTAIIEPRTCAFSASAGAHHHVQFAPGTRATLV